MVAPAAWVSVGPVGLAVARRSRALPLRLPLPAAPVAQAGTAPPAGRRVRWGCYQRNGNNRRRRWRRWWYRQRGVGGAGGAGGGVTVQGSFSAATVTGGDGGDGGNGASGGQGGVGGAAQSSDTVSSAAAVGGNGGNGGDSSAQLAVGGAGGDGGNASSSRPPTGGIGGSGGPVDLAGPPAPAAQTALLDRNESPGGHPVDRASWKVDEWISRHRRKLHFFWWRNAAPKPKEPVSVKHKCNDGYRLCS